MDNVSFFNTARNSFRSEIADLNRKWGWYAALGGFLVILGWAAAGAAVATTLLSVTMLGWTLFAAGAALMGLSLMSGKWNGFLLTLAAGALSTIAGIAAVSYPLAGAVAITLIVGAILVAAGIFRSVASVIMKFPNWGWSLVSGLTSLALGTVMLKNWQSTSLYLLGCYIGIDLIFHGLSWIMFSLRVHRLARFLDTTDIDRRAA